jgi:cytochrome b involved in lipid metabolism/plastocyanin
MHPGGAAAILNQCGKDATTAFTTKGGIGSHSSGAWTLLGTFLVGTLSGPAPTTGTGGTPVSSSYTASQITPHSSSNDCWIVVGTNVYSVGAYLALHPGGAYAISKYCGKNATTAFGNRGGTGSHSAAAVSMLGGFLIGTLSGPAPASSPVNPAPTTGYTLTQVAAHAVSTDCWLVIGSSVYSVTNYISLHPGGRTRIINMCGKDATTSFNNVGHSATAKSILGGLLIGSYLGNTGTIPPPTPTPISGTCGSANGTSVASAPTTNLCSSGTATAVSGTGPFTWSCTGSNGGTTASCSASLSTGGGTTPTPVNGVCGSSNSATVSSAPTTNLCSSGTATAVSGSGPFTWSCTGSNGGTTASCSAQKTATSQTYTVTVNSSGTFSQSSMTLNAGDKITFSYTSSSGEAKVSITPSTVFSASFTLDKDIKTKTVTFNVSGTYSFSVR